MNLREFARGGWGRVVLPADVIRVDRRTRWGNPWRIGDDLGDGLQLRRDDVLRLYRDYAILRSEDEPEWLAALAGKRLACWCAPEPCHAEILVELGA